MPPVNFKLLRAYARTVRGTPPWMKAIGRPTPQSYMRVFGVTKDSSGVALGGCTVHLFTTADDVRIDSGVSDASGNYEFRSAGTTATYYVVAYKAGSPDVSGTTVNTLVGS